MNISSRLSSNIFLVACLLANLMFIPNAVAEIANAKKSETKLSENEDTSTNVPPQKMVVRVCRALADISDGSKYEL